MKIFLDSANLKEIQDAASWGAIDGITTNPSLIAKENRDPFELFEAITRLVPGPVSAEVVSTTCDEMVEEGRRLSRIAKNIVVKCPLIKEGLKATKILSAEGIPVNVTLCFSANQALLAAKAGAAYISPFVGRLDDIGEEGMLLIRDIKTIYQNYRFKTEILVASIRNPVHVLEAARIGADVGTMPFSVLESLLKHPLTEAGLKRFLDDWAKVPQAKAAFEKVRR